MKSVSRNSPSAASPPRVSFALLKNDMLAVSFPYDAALVERIKLLDNRRWNKRLKRWEIHLAHLEELKRIFRLDDADLPAPVTERFRERWIDCRLRVRLDALHGRLSGAGAPLDDIDRATSFDVPGARYSPRFRRGGWDGRRHLFSRRTRRFPAGLWPRVREALERHDVRYAVESDGATPSESPPALEFPGDAAPLRPYQREALERAVERGRGIVQMATGGGKTLLAAHLIRRLAAPTFFFVHTRELLHQTARVFGEQLGVEVGRLGDGQCELRPVTVATIQTVARAFGLTVPRETSADEASDETAAPERTTSLRGRREKIREALASARTVIFDECHHVPADLAYKIAFRTESASHRFGLSATPWRDDGHDLLLEAALGEKICAVTCSDLIEQGFLIRPRIVMERAPGRMAGAGRAEYAEVYRRAIVENQSRNRVIANAARECAARGLSVLVLVTQVAHGRALLELMPEARLAIGALDSGLRRQYIGDLERKLHPILIATTLADEGLDIPTLDAVILSGGGKSASRAYQRIGRALRPAPEKKAAYIMDFYDDAPWLNEHSLARLRLYREEPAFDVLTRGFEA